MAFSAVGRTHAIASPKPYAHIITDEYGALSKHSKSHHPSKTSHHPSPPHTTSPPGHEWPRCAPNGTIVDVLQCILDDARSNHTTNGTHHNWGAKLGAGLGVGLGAGLPTAGFLAWLAGAGGAALYRGALGAFVDYMAGFLPWLPVLWALPVIVHNLLTDVGRRGDRFREAAEQVQRELEGDLVQQVGYLEELRAIEDGARELEEMQQILDRMTNGEPPLPPHEPLEWPDLTTTPMPDPLALDTSTFFSTFVPSLDQLTGSLTAIGIGTIAAEAMLPQMLGAVIDGGLGLPGGEAALAAGEAYLAPLAGPAASPEGITTAVIAAIKAAQSVSLFPAF